MIKAKITIYDDERKIEFVKDKVITPVYNHRLNALAKSYEFEFSLNVREPFPFFGDDRDFLTPEEIENLQ